LLATVVVAGEYVRRKVLGLPAFDKAGGVQFVKPEQMNKKSVRKRKKNVSKQEEKK
jgi:hypothetical protein